MLSQELAGHTPFGMGVIHDGRLGLRNSTSMNRVLAMNLQSLESVIATWRP